jgi:hypothetical protein
MYVLTRSSPTVEYDGWWPEERADEDMVMVDGLGNDEGGRDANDE